MIILEQKELLETFWQYLDRSGSTHNKDDKTDNDDDDKKKVDPGLESLLASYFAKTITIFLTKQPAEVRRVDRAKRGTTAHLDFVWCVLHRCLNSSSPNPKT
jgi:serine/threonine-protein phosphatase 6 regulatory subunit 3